MAGESVVAVVLAAVAAAVDPAPVVVLAHTVGLAVGAVECEDVCLVALILLVVAAVSGLLLLLEEAQQGKTTSALARFRQARGHTRHRE